MTTYFENNNFGIIKTWKRIRQPNEIFSFITKESTGYYLCFGPSFALSNECVRFNTLEDAMLKGEERYLEYVANVARFPPGVR